MTPLGTVLFIAGFSKVLCICDRNNGPVGEPECVRLNGYNGKQWATCLTDDYIQSNSFGTIKCEDRQTKYCYYQCMVELHGMNDGMNISKLKGNEEKPFFLFSKHFPSSKYISNTKVNIALTFSDD